LTWADGDDDESSSATMPRFSESSFPDTWRTVSLGGPELGRDAYFLISTHCPVQIERVYALEMLLDTMDEGDECRGIYEIIRGGTLATPNTALGACEAVRLAAFNWHGRHTGASPIQSQSKYARTNHR